MKTSELTISDCIFGILTLKNGQVPNSKAKALSAQKLY